MPSRWARLAIPITDFALVGSTRKLADTLRPPRFRHIFRHILVILLKRGAQKCTFKTLTLGLAARISFGTVELAK